jgi:hypothetical protein
MSDIHHWTRGIVAVAIMVLSGPVHAATAPEYKACHAGNTAACKQWRVRACRDGNPAACDYETAQKQSNPSEWCAQRYSGGSQYRFCLNGSPDR